MNAELSSAAGPDTIPAAADPVALPRLLPERGEPTPVELARHLARHGPLPVLPPARIPDVVQAAGLTGRGGAGFPVHRKLRTVAAGRGPVVVANGAEGEPASSKDAVLLGTTPHLVLDGLQVAARAVGARRAYVYVHAGRGLEPVLQRALTERATLSGTRGSGEVPVQIVSAPPRFLAGEESAATQRISGGPAKPRSVPPRVFSKGVDGRPTLVQNVETLAHLGLIARFGPEWFRALGTADEPGSALFTVGGCVARPGVIEAGFGTTLRDLLSAAGGTPAPVQAVLFGGYHGTWLPIAQAREAVLSSADLRSRGGVLGAGVVVALPASACGLVETARAVRYLAAESAGQCGPCLNGLPAVADALLEVAVPRCSPLRVTQVRRWTDMIDGRGACHHPDGAVRFVRSALGTFASEVDAHVRGRCSATSPAAVLPVAPTPVGPQDWS